MENDVFEDEIFLGYLLESLIHPCKCEDMFCNFRTWGSATCTFLNIRFANNKTINCYMHTTHKLTLYDKKRNRNIRNNVGVVLSIRMLDSYFHSVQGSGM